MYALVTFLIAVTKEGDSGGKGLFGVAVIGNTAHREGEGMAAGMRGSDANCIRG